MASTNSSRECTTISQVLWPLLDYLHSQRVNVGSLLERVGHREETLRKCGRRVPRAVAVAIAEAAMTCDPSDGCGFTPAKLVRLESANLLTYWAASSSSLRGALEVLNRSAQILDDSAHFSLEPQQGGMLWRLDVNWPAHVQGYMFEYLLGTLRTIRGRAMGSAPLMREFWCAYSAPAHAHVYARHLDAPVRFDAGYNGCLLDHHMLDFKPPRADHVLANLLERCAGGVLKTPEPAQTFCDQVRRLIVECLADGEPSALQIAQQLGITASTLRRRLSAESSSYRSLMREVRLERTRAYLADGSLTMTEIAYRVGFSDTSAFFKAFKVMAGVTPSEYRENLLQAQALKS